ncbi:MAG: VTT domain-containing protein [Anaerolineales bacterium]|jgi:membrane protein DedA with SNARE-associated domain
MIASPESILDLLSNFWNALQHGAVLPLGNWNYLILYVFVIIQGPLVKLLSGALVANTLMNIFSVILVSVIASLTADLVWFRVGRSGNIQRFLRRKPPKQRKLIEKLQTGMRTHYFKILLLGKMSLGMTVPSMVAAGASKIPWRKWFPAVLVGEILFTTSIVMLGYFAAESLDQVNRTLQAVGIGVSAFVLLFLAIYLPRTLRKIITDSSPSIELELGSTD